MSKHVKIPLVRRHYLMSETGIGLANEVQKRLNRGKVVHIHGHPEIETTEDFWRSFFRELIERYARVKDVDPEHQMDIEKIRKRIKLHGMPESVMAQVKAVVASYEPVCAAVPQEGLF